jgi:hypothetical protein
MTRRVTLDPRGVDRHRRFVRYDVEDDEQLSSSVLKLELHFSVPLTLTPLAEHRQAFRIGVSS